MTPQSYYQQQLDAGVITFDPQQQEVVAHLQRVSDRLMAKQQRRWWQKIASKPLLVPGLYLWGSVGVGKTFLMDCFCQSLSLPYLRLHFYAFMQDVHRQLKQHQGQVNPLRTVAQVLASQYTVICFDEFFVDNIADAMLLGTLLEALFHQGVCLVVTSNLKPESLYQEGLQRERFLPAIALLEQNLLVFHMIAHHDYRGDHSAEVNRAYFYPASLRTEQYMKSAFEYLSQGAPVQSMGTIEVLGRAIKLRCHAGGCIWFNFADICMVPRASIDYLELVQHFHTFIISDVPELTGQSHHTVLLFIQCVDVLYDAKRRLVLSSAVAMEALYTGGRFSFEFRRVLSRLKHMQSQAYFDQVQDKR